MTSMMDALDDGCFGQWISSEAISPKGFREKGLNKGEKGGFR